MARFPLARTPGFEAGLDYNASNGRVTAVYTVNNTGRDMWVEADLTDSTRHSRISPTGDTPLSLPRDAVKLTFDAQGEPVFTGLAAIRTGEPPA